MPNVLRRPLLLLSLLVLGACGTEATETDGSDADDGSTPVAADSIEVRRDGHQSAEDHTLAVGRDTPKDPKGRYYLHPGDRGPDVTTMQARLIELGAPIRDSDGIYGDHTLHAVLAFQRSEQLTADGVVGTATWAALDAPTLRIDWDLPDVPTEYATDVPTSAATTGAEAEPTTGDAASVPRGTAPRNDPAAGGGAWTRAVVSLSSQTATFYDGSGAVVLRAPISSGRDGLTPVGTFHVQSKSSRAFAGNGVYMDSMTRFNGGIGFHSIPKRATGDDIATPLGQAPVSHGCIRMADAQAKQVFDSLPIGAVVQVVS